MHWADLYAGRLQKKGGDHVIETGTSISGVPHVGNASDVIRGDAVRKSLEERGVKVELIWVADDGDPFRKTPAGMETLADYIGFPVKDIPDPQGCHKSFVDHFTEPFLLHLKEFGVTPKTYSATELYRSGALYKEIKTALEQKEKIIKILDEHRVDPMPPDFIPWNPVCGGCGRISTTRATEVSGDIVKYVCEKTDVSGTLVEGCGLSGESDIKNGLGKLPWRVEWAARWKHFKVTCEPLGKEHASAGGSYWTSKEISKRVYGWEPPIPVIYEFFTLGGEKISSSKGNVITLGDWFRIAEPEVLKYFMYKRLEKQRDINLLMIPNLTDEYDNAERVYFGLEEGEEKLARMYELSQIMEPRLLQVPYSLCAVLSQIPNLKLGDVSEKLERMGYEKFDRERLGLRLNAAGVWVREWGPDYMKFALLDDPESVGKQLNEKQKEGLSILAGDLKDEWTPELLHKRIYEVARNLNLDPPKLFDAIYLVLIGKERGPKAASFVLSLDRDFVYERFINLK